MKTSRGDNYSNITWSHTPAQPRGGAPLFGSAQPQRGMNVLGQQQGLTPERRHLLRSVGSEAALLKWPLAWLPSTPWDSSWKKYNCQIKQSHCRTWGLVLVLGPLVGPLLRPFSSQTQHSFVVWGKLVQGYHHAIFSTDSSGAVWSFHVPAHCEGKKSYHLSINTLFSVAYLTYLTWKAIWWKSLCAKTQCKHFTIELNTTCLI